ncbi:MAG: hydrogenase maturation protease [Deltaproteobacteria bacterium]|nr:hydrogenase maturation protease [Deltaproteobacteria bacterium]
MTRTLIIGYGNIDRADDGVAHEVINTLRGRQDLEPLDEENTGLEELGKEVDSIFLSQLTPELMELMCDYDRVVFVDAHISEVTEDLNCTEVLPDYAPSSLTHHLTPGMLLALVRALYGREPVGHLVSIRGHDFGFHRGLSPETHILMGRAVDHLLRWLNGQAIGTG